MKCEKCKSEHDGAFGSGRFCSRACANSRKFSGESRKKKSESNKKRVKEVGKWGFMLTPNILHTEKSIAKCQETWKKKLLESDFTELSKWAKRKRVVVEQDYKCHKCKLDEWMGKPLTLEVEHLNGDHGDDRRDNMIALCPNCHSLSCTWRGRNKSKKKGGLSDIEIVELYKEKGNIRQTLLAMGMAAKGDNYTKIKRILRRYMRA